MLHRLGSAICSSTVNTAITWRRGTWSGLQFHNSRHRGRCHYVGQSANSILLLLLLRSDAGCDLGHLETWGRTTPRTAYRLLLDMHQATIRPFRNGTAISACIQRKFQRKPEAAGVKRNITNALTSVDDSSFYPNHFLAYFTSLPDVQCAWHTLGTYGTFIPVNIS